MTATVHPQHHGFVEFYDIASAREWGYKHFEYWLKEHQVEGAKRNTFDDKEIAALKKYLGHNYININEVLRKGVCRGSTGHHDIMREEAFFIERTITEQKIPDNIILYRHLSCVKDMLLLKSGGLCNLCQKTVTSGSILMERGFMSTSLVYSKTEMSVHNNELLRILCPKGTRGAYVELISNRGAEQEVLLPPNKILRVMKIYKNFDGIKVFECVIENSIY